MKLASKGVHYLLYVLLVAQAVLGFLVGWSAGHPIHLFGIGIRGPFGALDRPVRHQIREIHQWVGYSIVIIAAGHALAALYHHYRLHDRVLGRMFPPARKTEEARGRLTARPADCPADLDRQLLIVADHPQRRRGNHRIQRPAELGGAGDRLVIHGNHHVAGAKPPLRSSRIGLDQCHAGAARSRVSRPRGEVRCEIGCAEPEAGDRAGIVADELVDDRRRDGAGSRLPLPAVVATPSTLPSAPKKGLPGASGGAPGCIRRYVPWACASTRKSLPIIDSTAAQPVPLVCSEKPKSPTRANAWSAKSAALRPVALAWARTRPETRCPRGPRRYRPCVRRRRSPGDRSWGAFPTRPAIRRPTRRRPRPATFPALSVAMAGQSRSTAGARLGKWAGERSGRAGGPARRECDWAAPDRGRHSLRQARRSRPRQATTGRCAAPSVQAAGGPGHSPNRSLCAFSTSSV